MDIDIEFFDNLDDMWLDSDPEITPEDLNSLAEQLDAVLFGPIGSIAQRIDAQGFTPLSPSYREWKRKEGYNTDIWIKTGRFQKIIEQKLSGKDKTVLVHPENILGSGLIWEAVIEAVEYSHADKKRPLLNWEKEDELAAEKIIVDWYGNILQKHIDKMVKDG